MAALIPQNSSVQEETVQPERDLGKKGRKGKGFLGGVEGDNPQERPESRGGILPGSA